MHDVAIRFSALGDIATTIPYLKLLNQPLIITSPMGFELLKDEFENFDVINPRSFFDRWRIGKKIKEFRVFDFQNNRKSRSITKRVKYIYDNRFMSIEEIRSRPIWRSYELILQNAGIEQKPDTNFQPKEKSYIVLNAGSSPKWTSKRLPLHKWKEFSEILYERFGLPFVLTGDKSEAEYVQDVAKVVVGKKEVIAGKTSIQELKKVLKEAYLVVSTDSAPMHIAAVQKTPTIGLFGATNWILSRPFGPWSTVVYDKELFKDGKPFEKNRKEIGKYYENIDIKEGLNEIEKFLT